MTSTPLTRQTRAGIIKGVRGPLTGAPSIIPYVDGLFPAYRVLDGLSRSSPTDIAIALRRYEQHNADLPPAPRRLLAVAAIRPYFGTQRVARALGQSLPPVVFDQAWRWWNVLNYAGLGDHWDKFKDLSSHLGPRAGYYYLLDTVSREALGQFCRRAGSNPRNGHKTTYGHVWTKGGQWPVYDNFTKIILLREHLPRRPLCNWIHRRLGHAGVRAVETELARLINPDVMLVLDTKLHAISYARHRIAELAHLNRPRASDHTACWFFQCIIPSDQAERVLEPIEHARYIRKRRIHLLRKPWGV